MKREVMVLCLILSFASSLVADTQQNPKTAASQSTERGMTEIRFVYQPSPYKPFLYWVMYSNGQVVHRQESMNGVHKVLFHGKCEPEIFNRLIRLLVDSDFYKWKTDGWPQTDGPVWPSPIFVGLVKNNKQHKVMVLEGSSDKREEVADQVHKVFSGLKLIQYKKKAQKNNN